MDNEFNSSSHERNTKAKLQIVQAGNARFGIPTEAIATVVRWQKPAPLPHAPKSVLGVVSVQGRMLTVLDLKALTSPDSGETGNDEQSFLVALRGDEQLAIAVDSLVEEIQFDDQPRSGIERRRLISQVLPLDGADISVIDVKQLFPLAIQGRQRRKRQF